MVVIGILSAVAIPRYMGRGGFDVRGYSDQAQAAVRYAQKTAVGKRRNVFVAITAGSASVCYDAGCATPVTDPVSGNPLVATAPSGVTLGPAATFSFNGLGQPSIAADLTITVSAPDEVPRSFTIRRETGYVSSP